MHWNLEASKKWRNEWLQQITLSRDVDHYFKDLVEKYCDYTCEKHFKPEDM